MLADPNGPRRLGTATQLGGGDAALEGSFYDSIPRGDSRPHRLRIDADGPSKPLVGGVRPHSTPK